MDVAMRPRCLLAPALMVLLFSLSPAGAESPFVRGDANADGGVDLSDAVTVLFRVFLGGAEPPCLDAADADDSGSLDITDPITVLSYLFIEGRSPKSPFPECGLDPTADALGCASFPPCAGVNLPPRAAFSASARTGVAPLKVDVDAGASNDPDGQLVSYLWDFGDGGTAQGEKATHSFAQTGSFTVTLTVKDDRGAAGSSSVKVIVREPGVPPDPSDVAPALDGTSVPSFAEVTSFLHGATDPVQTGVDPAAIVAQRASVLRGRVTDRAGAPLRGVALTVLNHPELGSTLTRPDGMFDLVVNGGGTVVVDYRRSGFLPAQRQVDVPWNDYRWLPDVALVPLDPQVTAIDLTGPMQAARGSAMTDADGTRQATVLFPQGTTAEMVLADGTKQPLASLHVRATEYTVGDHGPEAMPAELPPTSGYTYCVELSADEAIAAGATTVRFNAPLPFYLENFLGFPVGTPVPLGAYDRTLGVWIPDETGTVVKLLSVTGGAADLDLDGDGTADGAAVLAALGITVAERQRLATLYAPGQTLWRVRIPHFSIWDCNMGIMPPPDAEFPGDDPSLHRPEDDVCRMEGNSVIEVQNQVLGEAVAVRGTPFSLVYQSERVPGRKEAYTIGIPLSGAQLPASVHAIELEVAVAGLFSHQTFPAETNRSTTFTWDGKNAYGQTLQGEQPITVRIGYTYGVLYGVTSRFGHDAGEAITLSPSRKEVTLWRIWRGRIGTWDARGNGFGGWALDVHHAYDPAARVLYRGDGGRESAASVPSTIDTFAGTGAAGAGGDGGPATAATLDPVGLAVGPDGSLYIASALANRVRRVTPDGTIHTVAGNGNQCSPQLAACGDGGPATEALLGSPYSLAVGPDGSLYIGQALSGRQVVRKVDPSGTITTIAGTGTNGFSGDDGPATLAEISSPVSLAAAPDGSLYIADESNRRIRRVAADGIISTVVGTGDLGSSGDGGPARLAQLSDPRGVAAGADGSLYIADTGAGRVRMVTPDGTIRTIAGTGAFGFSGDGGPATEATFKFPTAVAVGADGTLYILDSGNFRVRWMRPGGTIDTLAGSTGSGSAGDRGPARRATLLEVQAGLAVGPDGGLFVSQSANDVRVRRISPLVDGFLGGAAGEIAVPSGDGGELYVFTVSGRHLRTEGSLTGALRHRFTYDAAGRLATVVDGDGNETVVERDAAGNPTAIVGPYGRATALELNADGYLERITSPSGETVRPAYTADGLLTALTGPGGRTSRYAYDALGRLTSATDPAGAAKTLARSGTDDDYTVTLTTAMGRETSFRVERLSNGDVRRTTSDCTGARSVVVIGSDGRLTGTDADGTTRTLVLGPDPRWGMTAPLAASVSVSMPGGLTLTTTTARTVELAAPGDVLHIRSLVTTETTNGRVTTSAYDAPSRTLVLTSPAGRVDQLVFDDRGRTVEAHAADLDPVAFAYDPRGRLAGVEQGEGAARRVVTFGYGVDGDLASHTDALGRTTTYVHDDAGGLIEEDLPGGRTFRFAFDLDGDVRGVTPPGRTEHTFAFTAAGDVAAYTPPLVGAEPAEVSYSYDADRKSTRIDHPGGGSVQFGYEDGTCELTLVDLAGRQRTISYDAAGRPAALGTSQATSLAHAYDGAVFTGATWSGAVAGSVTQAYDADLLVAALRVNGADPLAISYDADGLPVQVGALAIARSPVNGAVVGTSIGEVGDSFTYDGFGALRGYTASYKGAAIYAATFSYDARGRIVEETETIEGAARTFSFAYDLSERLTEVRRDGVASAGFTYDANGNRTSRTDSGGTSAATYDAQDRLIAHGGAAYAHNPRGERTSKTAGGQTTTYRYEGFGSLIGATLADGTQIEYLLDGLDRRIGKRVNGVLVQAFLYQDGLRPIAELNGAGTVVGRFVYATERNVPDYLVKGGATYRLITDHLGSPRLVVDVATGQVAQRMDHDEFGRVTLDTNPGFQPFGFAGGIYDRQTGLVHFNAREYDPETGRWTVKDPIGFSGGDGNLYAYCADDPLDNVDPEGLTCLTTVDCYCMKHPCICAEIGVAGSKAADKVNRAGAAVQRGGQAVVNTAQRVVAACPSAPQVAQTVNRAISPANPVVRIVLGQSGPASEKFRIAVQAIQRLRPNLSPVDAERVLQVLAGNLGGMANLRSAIANGQLARLLNLLLPK